MIRILLLCFVMSMFPGCSCEKKAAKEEHHEEGTVHLKEESQKMVNLELVKVQRMPLKTKIEVVGEIAKETENVVHITSQEPGRLKAYLMGPSETVEKDTPICVIETKTGTELTIASPSHGIVLAQYLKPGDAVDTLTSIMTIANPDILRASFNVHEKDLAGIKLGQKVLVKSIAYPERTFEGEIVFISPAVDENTRAIKIRVDLKNEEHLLKFGMFVTGDIVVPVSEPVLTVPEEAIQEVEDSPVVFVPSKEEKDEFNVQKVKLGRTIDEQVEILSGVSEGEEIVGKGSFYLKSELLKGELEEGHAH